MMRTVSRVSSLFVAYSLVGFGGDYMAGLLADDEVRMEREIELEVDVQVRTTGDCAFEIDRELRLPVSVGDLLEIDAGAGSLLVEGREGLGEVVAVGRVCAPREDLVEDLRLTMDRDGNEVTLSAHYPDRRSSDGRDAGRIDLTIAVPMGMDVDIDDSSGDISVSGVGHLEVDDSSGSIQVSGAAGIVDIEDSSGGIEVTGVAGGVEIEDGSGGISVQGVAGPVEIEDGSGGIEISDVAADVRIEADGSGGIDVRNVTGSFVVERDGSGGIRYSNVAGSVEIPARRGR